jgi:hypothetical protein
VTRYGGGAVKTALAFAAGHVGVTEHPAGSNRGVDVDAWERACGVLGAPWCGCFVNACLVAAGFPNQFWLRYCPSIEAKAKAGEGGWEWHGRSGGGRSGPVRKLHRAACRDRGGGQPAAGIGRRIEGNTSNTPGGSSRTAGLSRAGTGIRMGR